MRIFVPLAASASMLLQVAPPAVDIATLVQLASGWVVRFETSLSGASPDDVRRGAPLDGGDQGDAQGRRGP